MFKRRSTALVLCLMVPFVLPSNLMAGPFGFLRLGKSRCCKTSCCAKPTGSASVKQAVPTPPEFLNICGVYAMAMCDGEYQPCFSDVVYREHNDCSTAVSNARDAAMADLIAKCGENPQNPVVDIDCDPYSCSCAECNQSMMRAKSGWEYKVTVRIRCCNGCCIKQSVTHPNREFAKRFAKGIACHKAKTQCCGHIRSCTWTCCRVPAGSK